MNAGKIILLLFFCLCWMGCDYNGEDVELEPVPEPEDRNCEYELNDFFMNFNSLFFIDELTGWIVGEYGSIIYTNDGGKTCQKQRSGVISDIHTVFFIDKSTGWVAGINGTILFTNNGGNNWERQQSNSNADFYSIIFIDENNGWISGWHGEILYTNDGGSHWKKQQSGIDTDLYSIFFIDNRTGWSVGKYGVILTTTNGGKDWQMQYNQFSFTLNSVFFIDNQIGWAVGKYGVLLSTTDGGKNWKKAESGVSNDLFSVFFIDKKNGWIACAKGTGLYTNDGGNTWLKQMIDIYAGGLRDIRSIYFNNINSGYAVGSFGGFFRTFNNKTYNSGVEWLETVFSLLNIIDFSNKLYVKPIFTRESINYSPYISGLKEIQNELSIKLILDTTDDNDIAYIKLQKIEIKQTTTSTWVDITENTEIEKLKTPPGRFKITWNPASIIPENNHYQYRITLIDSQGLSFSHEIPKIFTCNPWWNNDLIQKTVIVVFIIIIIILVFLFLFIFFPLSLLWLYNKIPHINFAESLTLSKFLSIPLNLIFFVVLLPFLAKHRRTCDAWIKKHLEAFQTYNFSNKTYKERLLYIPLPVKLITHASSEIISTPDNKHFKKYFSDKKHRTVITITGTGGSGKSTLACRFMKWVLSEYDETRLAPHYMIPVFIEQEVENIFDTIRKELRRITGQEDIEDWFIRRLLKTKRILIIIDALSERAKEMQEYIKYIHGEIPVLNALVITSRWEIFDSPGAIQVIPEKLDKECYKNFFKDYIFQKGYNNVLPGAKYWDLGKKLGNLASSGSIYLIVTPLLIRLYIDHAVKVLDKGGTIKNLPGSVPETIMVYLEELNPDDEQTPCYISDDVLRKAARILGYCSLKDTWTPALFYEDDAISLLKEAGLQEQENISRRFVLNGILSRQKPGGISKLQFQFDPIAEYLAALYLIYKLRGNEKGWNDFLDSLKIVDGFPWTIKGFLVALDDCVKMYKSDFGIPDIEGFFNKLEEKRII